MELKADLFFPDRPPPYTATEQGINNSDILISLPEVVENPSNGNGGTEPLINEFHFSDKTIRQGFLKKVYSTILVQLLVTAVITTWFIIDTRVQIVVKKCPGLFLGVMITILLATSIAMTCFQAPRQRVPWNYICLMLFTLSLAVLLGVCVSYIPYEEVLIASGVTFAVVLVLTLFAFQTRIDFTVENGFIICIAVVVLLFGIAIPFAPVRSLHLLYAALVVLIMSLHLVYDTQLMITGKHRYSISPEEYIYAALNIYLDIIYIFVQTLQLIRR